MTDGMKKRLCLLGAGLCLLHAGAVRSSAAPKNRTGDLVPLVTARDLDGETIRMNRAVSRGAVLVLFWDYLRATSHRAISAVNSAARDYGPRGLTAIAVEGEGTGPAGVRERLEKLGSIGTRVTVPVVADTGGTIYRQYRVESTPELFLVGRGGKVLWHLRGFGVRDGEALEDGVKEALGLVPPPVVPQPPPVAAETGDDVGEPLVKCSYFGNYHFRKGNMGEAVRNYEECLAERPDDIPILLKAGEAYARLDRYEKARETWERVLQLDPRNAEADANIRRLIRGGYREGR